MNTDILAEALVETTEALWRASINPTPNGRAAFDWMHAPRLGDLVCVLHTRNQAPVQRVGIWSHSWSHLHPLEEDWDDYGPEMFYDGHEEVYLVEQFDGGETSWTNVELLRVPRDATERRDMFAAAERHQVWA